VLYHVLIEGSLRGDGSKPKPGTNSVPVVGLRVEFLLKTDSGYPRDAEVTEFTLANPEHSLRFNTHWSAPPVSAIARSGGPRKMSQSPVSRNSNIERRMDRPRAVVGFIRGVAFFFLSAISTGAKSVPVRNKKICLAKNTKYIYQKFKKNWAIQLNKRMPL